MSNFQQIAKNKITKIETIKTGNAHIYLKQFGITLNNTNFNQVIKQ